MNSNLVHPLSEYCAADVVLKCAVTNAQPTYFYKGQCLQTGELLQLPRTLLAETIAYGLMNHLAQDDRFSYEGKMYGVLLVEITTDQWGVLQAFSGLLQGERIIEGWVPPIPGRDQVAFEEAITLSKLESAKQSIIALQQLPERQQYAALVEEFAIKLQQLKLTHQYRKQQRQQQRQHFSNTLNGIDLINALADLDEQSRRDGIAERCLKQERTAVLQPLKSQIEQADMQIHRLKQRRKALSRHLQTQMHVAYSLTNFAGQTASLQELMSDGALPTGTGDCCAPKLLHYAATHKLKPVALAEFWWGASLPTGDKIQGKFYGACAERCQPIMGFLLSGLSAQKSKIQIFPTSQDPTLQNLDPQDFDSQISASRTLPIVYADQWLIAVNKPPGLLSVPGRYLDRQDSVLSRLQCSLDDTLIAVHRLDQETSGILLLARGAVVHGHLSQQFQQRQVDKVYEAILAGVLLLDSGVIELPLWADPDDRPYQKIDWQRGKSSITQYRVISRQPNVTRVEFRPLTGRTHQLRVHAAQGLGTSILGDRLYGNCKRGDDHALSNHFIDRLYLHARELRFLHPHSKRMLHLQVKTPF